MTALEERQQRSFTLSVVLLGAMAVAGGVLIIESCDNLGSRFSDGALAIPAACLVLLIGFGGLARRGHYRWAATGVVGLCMFLGTYFLVCWSSDVPQGILLYILVIAVTGSLLGSRAAIAMAAAAAMAMELLTYGQWRGLILPDTTWMQRPPAAADVLVPALSFGFMAALMWASNRKAEQLARRPWIPEEIQRMAGFGQLSAGILHDIANSLTAASLSIQQLEGEHRSQLVGQIAESLQHAERYLEAARKQWLARGEPQSFDICLEIEQAISVLVPQARQLGVVVELVAVYPQPLYGDPIRCNQLMMNLIANAIAAYQQSAASDRRVQVKVRPARRHVEVLVQDWGVGVRPAARAVIFEAAYTTKREGSGLGLARVKEIAEVDFGGSVRVRSSRLRGTRFVVRLPLRERAEAKC